MKSFFFILLAGIILLSCHTSKTSSGKISPGNNDLKSLNGSWQLQTLFASDNKWQKAPMINLDIKEKTFSGNGGCNAISGKLIINENYFGFDKNILSTKMACTGSNYEKPFLSALVKINTYTINKNELELGQGEIVLMKFKRTN